MKNKSSLGILGLLLVIAGVVLVWKFMWWILVAVGVLALLFVILLIRSSKKSAGQGGADDLESQVRAALSKIRQQKFKSEANINRLKEWANDAIETTYGDLFDDKVLRTELFKNYAGIKAEYDGKLEAAQIAKTEQIVNDCLKNISLEESKIETLDKLQVEHEQLKQKLKNVKLQSRKNQRLDKHVERLNSQSEDLSGEEVIAKADYTIDDLKAEVELKQEYVKQLEEVSMKYGDNSDNYQNMSSDHLASYQNEIEALKNKLK